MQKHSEVAEHIPTIKALITTQQSRDKAMEIIRMKAVKEIAVLFGLWPQRAVRKRTSQLFQKN